MIDSQAEHESMIRRVEQAQKALSPHVAGRSRRTGVARALGAVLGEAHERMNMAWAVLNEPYFGQAKHYTYRAQKAAELGICYTTISNAYDELCQLGVIGKDEKTEPTTQDLIRAQKEGERAARASRRRVSV